MTIPVIKNIKFLFVQIKNGIASIDTSMTDKAFDTNKPQGIYRCFIFPREYFSGVDHGDLINFVNIEKSSMWDETIRSTFLGYNAASNEFILNLTAYYGLKDNDLKTSGKLKYSGQASWQVMTLSTTKQSDSIVTLKQIDGTDVYLSIKPIELKDVNSTVVYPPLSVEIEKKSIKDVPLLVKNEMLWAKSTEDGVPIMVNNCVKTVNLDSNTASISDNNKKYGYTDSIWSKDYYIKSMRFGKELIYFDSTSTTEKAPLFSFQKAPYIINKTGVSSVEYTDTSSLSDILSSGESLTFQISPKYKYVCGYQTKETGYNPSVDYPNVIAYDTNQLSFSKFAISASYINFGLTEFINKNVVGYEYDLISCDTRKPFLFNSTGRIYGVSTDIFLNVDTIFENLPDGYIALMVCSPKSFSRNTATIVRWKKGENPKSRDVTSEMFYSSYISINGTTQFGNEIYDPNTITNNLTAITFDLDDVVNATAFTDITDSKIMDGVYFPLITIVRL